MEKIPGLRIVGGAPEEDKKSVRDRMEFRLTNHIDSIPESGRIEIKKSEYIKSPEELALISLANQETNKLRAEFGLEPYEIPPENYHIVPDELYKKAHPDGNGNAVCLFNRQALLFKASRFRNNNFYFGSVAFHETLHIKGYFSLEVEKHGEKTIETSYRTGISVASSQKKNSIGEHHSHFDGLHEGIVSEQQRRFNETMLNTSMMQKEKDRLGSDHAQEIKRVISDRRGIPIEDIMWVGNNQNEYETLGYPKQREVLLCICREISRIYPDEYPIPNDVYREFLRAHLTGKLLTIARLVNKTFGEDSFRLLGDMKTDRESVILTLELFNRKARLNRSKAI